MEKKAIVKVEKTDNDDRVCRCCNSVATTFIELGQDFNRFIQTSSIYLCDEHANELKLNMKSIK